MIKIEVLQEFPVWICSDWNSDTDHESDKVA